MILLLLVSTLQFSVYKMECISGKTQVSLSNFDDCNQSPKNSTSISKKCCEFYDITFNFDYDTNIQLKDIKLVDVSTLSLNFSSILFQPLFNKFSFNNYTNLPPPSGIELLKLVQVFRL